MIFYRQLLSIFWSITSFGDQSPFRTMYASSEKMKDIHRLHEQLRWSQAAAVEDSRELEPTQDLSTGVR
jgi:uncharacterized protein YecA (UPF0149 family)